MTANRHGGRPGSGSIVKRATSQGFSFALRVSYLGERHFVSLGGSWDGWDDERAEAERAYVAAQIARGEWVPPARAAPSDLKPASAQDSFQVFASTCLARRARKVADTTYRDYRWRLEVAMDHFGSYALGDIDVSVIDGFVDGALRERDEIDQAAATGRPLFDTVVDTRGRRYRRRRRGLDRSSINKVTAVVRMVLKDALRRGLIQTNPAADPELRLREPRPIRPFLEPGQIDALLTAARALEARHRGLDWEKVRYIRRSERSNVALARELHVSDVLISKVRRGLLWSGEPEPRNRNDIARHAIVITLVLAGVRISELCGLEGRDIDLAGRRLRVRREITKTDAGVRTIPLLPGLRDVLAVHRSERPYGPEDYVFATRTGSRNDPDNIRSRIVSPAHAQANELLAARETLSIERLTPHTLRRTFASILAECGVSPRRAMYLLGHTDPKLTMSVYQQVLDMSQGAAERLERILGGELDELGRFLSGRAGRAAPPAFGVSSERWTDAQT